MATIEIRDILDNETGKTIFPRTHVDAIIGLKDFSFFEAVQDTQDPTKFSVKLKSEYTGLWAEGFVAAGGVGQGGGGGGASYLDGLEDVTAPDPNDGDLLVYNGLAGEWQNKSGLSDYGASLSLTTVSTASYLKDSDGNYLLDSNGNRLAVGESSSVTRLNLLNRSGIVLSSVELDMDLSSYATRSWVTQNFQPTISDLATIRENASDGAAKVSNVQSDWDATSGLAVILNKPDLSVYALQSSLDLVSGRVTALEDLFEIVDGNIHVKNGRALYSDSWIASGGIGSGSGGGGGIDLDRMWQSLTNNTDKPNVEINIAHIPTLTAAKIPDITTAKVSDINTWVTSKGLSIAGLSVNIGGSITAAALRQALGISGDETPTISSVVLTNGANYSEITVDDTSASFYTKAQIDSALADYATNLALAGKQDKYPFTITGTSGETYALGNFVTIAGGQTITGAKTFSAWLTASGGIITGGDIYPSTDLGGSLGYGDHRFSNGNIQTIGTSTIYLKNSSNGNSGLISASGGYLVVRAGADLNTSYKQLILHETYGFYPDGTGVNLGYSGANSRWQTIYGVNGNLTGDLSMESSSHIDIGPLRIEYDATNKALHITKVSSSDTNNYGLYADGFIAAGGVGQTS